VGHRTARAERRERRKSPFLRYADDAGRVADFHALRHTYVSRVVASGASVKVAQELARHSTPTLTIGRYAHVRLHDLTPALDALDGPAKPAAEQPLRLAATGTDDADADDPRAVNAQYGTHETARTRAAGRNDESGRTAKGNARKSLTNAAQNKTPRDNAGACESEGDGARTRNLRIDRLIFPNSRMPLKCAAYAAKRRYCTLYRLSGSVATVAFRLIL